MSEIRKYCCVSVNFRNADISIRKQLAFTEEQKRKLISEFNDKEGGCVLICTCNRTEIYCFETADRITAAMAAESGMKTTDLTSFISVYYDKKAYRHLYRLACGIDSMVIGEDEILRQVKNAYEFSVNAGASDFLTNTLFQSALSCAKRIKTETSLSTTPVSVATLAANEAASFAGNVSVLVIGATGTTGSSVVKNLAAHNNVNVAMTVRKHGGKLTVPDIPEAEVFDYSQRYDLIDRFDCVICATSSPHYVLTAEKLKSHISPGRKRLFIDLAVPPDIEDAVSETDGVQLEGIDHFSTLAAKNNEIRLDSAAEAENIIDEELDEMLKKIIFHSFLPRMKETLTFMESIPAEKLIYIMKSELDSTGFKKMLDHLSSAESEA